MKLATAIIEFICIADLEGAYIIFREGLEETVINLTNHPNQKIGLYSRAYTCLIGYRVHYYLPFNNVCISFDCLCLFYSRFCK